MSGIETRFGAEDDAERIRAAFYGFVAGYVALLLVTVLVYVIPRASLAKQRI